MSNTKTVTRISLPDTPAVNGELFQIASGDTTITNCGRNIARWSPRTRLNTTPAGGSSTETILSVRWRFWEITQSQYHTREIGEVNLGNLDA